MQHGFKKACILKSKIEKNPLENALKILLFFTLIFHQFWCDFEGFWVGFWEAWGKVLAFRKGAKTVKLMFSIKFGFLSNLGRVWGGSWEGFGKVLGRFWEPFGRSRGRSKLF